MLDCVIVGGGLIGMLTARELARAGSRVAVVERGVLGGEASWAGGGILSPLYPWRAPEAVTRLAAWSQEHYPALAGALAAQTGIDPEWLPSGLLILDAGEAGAAERWAQRHGVALELPDGAALAHLEPEVGAPAERALLLPGVAQVRGPRLIRALRHSLAADGVVIREHVEARVLSREHGRVAGVGTAGGTIAAGAVVVAGGAWTGEWLGAQGVAVPITPVRGQMILYRAEPGIVSRIVLYRGRYVIPRRDGHYLVGSTMEEAGFDKATTEDARGELMRAAAAMVPRLRGCEVARHWAGLRPGSPAGIPFIGPIPGIAGLYVNSGHHRNGITLAPASARLLADLILGRPATFAVQPYAPPA